MRTFFFLLLLIPELSVAAELPKVYYVIPHTIVGSEIVVVNDDVNSQEVRVSFTSKTRFYQLAPHSFVRLIAPETGYVLISASTNHINAWSVVEGATFEAQKLNTSNREFVASRLYGLAIANPWPTQKTITLWVYKQDGTFSKVTNLTIQAGTNLVNWLGFFVPNLFTDDELVVQVLGGPFGVGVARWNSRNFDTIPVKSIRFDPVIP